MLFTCIAGAFTIMHKKATFVIYLVLQSTPTYINGMAGYSIIASKLEKQNTRLKPEMTGCYYCFSPRRILRLPRYSLTFGFPWTRPSVHSPWYQWHNCSFNMTLIQALFWLGNTSNRQGLLRCASHFLFRARFLWRSAICKLAMKWYPMRMCTRWLCPFNIWQGYLTFSYYFIFDIIVCVLVSFYQWGHFVMLIIRNLNLISIHPGISSNRSKRQLPQAVPHLDDYTRQTKQP